MGVGFPEFIVLLLSIVFFLVVFLVLRGLALWYWKIDKHLLNQETQIELMQQQLKLLQEQTSLLNTKAPNNAQE